jgi:dsDNA-specific endonuclease/ATPase MutS2
MSVASLAINPDTFEPTYRLVLGEIGASYGIKISERVGLPREIVDGAIQLLSAEEIRLNDLIIALTREKNTLSKIMEENALKMKELEQREREIAEKMENLQKLAKGRLRIVDHESAYLVADDWVGDIDRLLSELKSLLQQRPEEPYNPRA